MKDRQAHTSPMHSNAWEHVGMSLRCPSNNQHQPTSQGVGARRLGVAGRLLGVCWTFDGRSWAFAERELGVCWAKRPSPQNARRTQQGTSCIIRKASPCELLAMAMVRQCNVAKQMTLETTGGKNDPRDGWWNKRPTRWLSWAQLGRCLDV